MDNRYISAGEFYERNAERFQQDDGGGVLRSIWLDLLGQGSGETLARYEAAEKATGAGTYYGDDNEYLFDYGATISAIRNARVDDAPPPPLAPQYLGNTNDGEGNFEPASVQEISVLKPVSTVVIGAGVAALLLSALKG